VHAENLVRSCDQRSFVTARAAQQVLVGEGLLPVPAQGISRRVTAGPVAAGAVNATARARFAYRSLGEQIELLVETAAAATAPLTSGDSPQNRPPLRTVRRSPRRSPG
jgi:hypothetical protein